jgi:hypothetical protein
MLNEFFLYYLERKRMYSTGLGYGMPLMGSSLYGGSYLGAPMMT